jgi:very-short-patch-repair endonuclease
MNLTERLVWSRIRGRQLYGWKFWRQQPVGPYYVDFYCSTAHLAVEIDGPTHDDTRWEYDRQRQSWLESHGHRLVRISAGTVIRNLDEAIAIIDDALFECERMGLNPRPHPPASPGTSPQAGKS